jgi:hypothetical protein
MVSSAGNALSLIKAVLELVVERRTGVLDIRAEGVRTQIYFADGRPVFAEDEALGESFGRLLMRQGVISNDQFVRVIDEMTKAAAGSNQLRFGEVAVGLGLLTPEQVERGLAEQVCGIITRSLQRGESRWTFETSPPAPRPPRAFGLEINPAVIASLQKSADRSPVADVVAARPEELVVIAGARPTLEVRQEASGAPAEAHAARLTAEQAFQKGLALLRESKSAAAAVELRRASELQPESLEYLLYATWARARSFRDVPSEADQHTLLEIAQRAKRRDPLFAFGSYVIGQLSMWAGDDAAAKKWFYEALRLDPASDAGAQVRILARRPSGNSVMAPLPRRELSVVASLPRRELSVVAPLPGGEPPARPPVLAPEPPVPAKPSPPAPKAPPSRSSGRLGTGAALLAMVALAIFVVARRSAPRAGLAASDLPSPALSVDAAAPGEADHLATSAPRGDSEDERSGGGAPPVKAVKAKSEKDPDDDAMGTVVLPSRAAGHRIFVDGRRFKSEGDDELLHLRCGAHTVQIGSSGTPEPIDLPCGGEVQIK